MSDLYWVWHAALLRDLPPRPAAWTQVLAFTQNTEWIAHARGPRHTLAVWHETRYSDSTSTLRVVRLGPDGRALESPLTIATGRTVGNFGDDASVRADATPRTLRRPHAQRARRRRRRRGPGGPHPLRVEALGHPTTWMRRAPTVSVRVYSRVSHSVVARRSNSTSHPSASPRWSR